MKKIITSIFLFVGITACAQSTRIDSLMTKAEQGVAKAQYNLGECYYEGIGVPQDYKQAVYWYSKAAEQGLAEAQYNLGLCYDEGKGVTPDYKQAVYWLSKAAKQGYADAQELLKKIR